jgi:translation initiation factor IF-2
MATAPSSRTPNSFLVFCGSLLALLIVAALFVFSIAEGPRPSDLDAKRAENRIAVRTKLEKEAAEALTTEAWVDKAKGIVRVPVESVIAATAKELAAKKAAPSQVKVEPPLPMPVVDPTSTEPPPPALPSAPQGADTVRFAYNTAPAAAAPAATPVPAPKAATPAPAPAAATPPSAVANPVSTAPTAALTTRPPLINWTEPLAK